MWAQFANEDLTVCGDGQCDSPGFSAKNLCYYIMEMIAGYVILKLINYSCRSYPSRACYSGQVKIDLNTTACLEIISSTDAIVLNLHIDKARKTHDDKQLYLITHFTKQTLNLNYLLLTLNVTVRLLNSPKQKGPFFFKFKFSLNCVDLVF